MFPKKQRTRWAGFLLLGLAALLVVASAQSKPNFSGTWKLNAEKSDFGAMPGPKSRTDKIDHQDPDLKVTSTVETQKGEYTSNLKYTTDGKESTNQMRNNPVKSTAKWDGDALAIDSKANFNGNDVTIKDKWSLSKDGKTLTINRQLEGPQGKAEQKVVLEKQ